QSRIDANEAAVNAIGRSIQRPINDWCADTSVPPPGQLCPDGRPPGPEVAEGWDDWGPFYTAMYAQHVGLDSSTVEMCDQTDQDCALPGTTLPPEKLGRLGSRLAQYTGSWATFLCDPAKRHGPLGHQRQLERG